MKQTQRWEFKENLNYEEEKNQGKGHWVIFQNQQNII